MKINEGFLAQMREATQILQDEGPRAAAAAIQRALHGAAHQGGADSQSDWTKFLPQLPEQESGQSRQTRADRAGTYPDADILDRLRKFKAGKWAGIMARQTIEDVEVRETADLAGKGRYLAGSCTNHAGTRAYKLYIPSCYTGKPLPLVVMLHGCTQNPDDFAAGTGMNQVAEENNCFVVYPAQTQSANASHCWNWFKETDQKREYGEPSIIADITREVVRHYKIDTRRIYVAGLSAGGAMAAVMGATYPDLFAAVGIHSGLPYAVAHDLPSALAAMKSRKAKVPAHKTGTSSPKVFKDAMPVIVFHGDRDTTVHPGNGDQVLAQCMPLPEATFRSENSVKVEKGSAASGRKFTKTTLHDEQGRAIAEKWVVHGAGHAWSGGSNKGSYTDPQGPDAAREMLRFFYTHVRDGVEK